MKKNVFICFLIVASLFLTGCAKKTPKTFLPVGGSKADATVKLSYDYNPAREIPVIDEKQTAMAAKRKCQAWGYQDASPFGAVISTCTRFDPWAGCINMSVITEYQCIGGTTTKQVTNNK